MYDGRFLYRRFIVVPETFSDEEFKSCKAAMNNLMKRIARRDWRDVFIDHVVMGDGEHAICVWCFVEDDELTSIEFEHVVMSINSAANSLSDILKRNEFSRRNVVEQSRGDGWDGILKANGVERSVGKRSVERSGEKRIEGGCGEDFCEIKREKKVAGASNGEQKA